MRIVVRSFGSYREAIGVGRPPVNVPQGSTASRAWSVRLDAHPPLRGQPRPFAFAVNDAHVPLDATLRDGDEQVPVPPLRGGGSGSGNTMPPQGGPVA